MNIFRLTKHNLVVNTSFSKSKNKDKTSSLRQFFIPFFSKKGKDFYAFFKKTALFQTPWRTNLRFTLISFFIALRVKVSPHLWVMRETVSILTTHVKATVLPFLWHLRYKLQQFFTPLTNQFSVLNDKLMVYIPPSVQKRLGGINTAVMPFLMPIGHFVKKQKLSKNLIMGAIAVVLSLACIKKIAWTTRSVKAAHDEASVREFQLSGRLQTTLYATLVQNHVSQELIDMVEDALKGKVDLKQSTNGDEYKIIWQEELLDEQSVAVKQQLTGVYIKQQIIGKPVYVFYYNNGIANGWYGNEGLPMTGGFLDSPVNKSTITSRFDWHRKHPVLGYRRPHLGTDYAAPRGTPIMSVADGVVEEAKFHVGNGRYVKIKHTPPFETEYLHMSRFGKGIEKGVKVKKRQVIGYIGTSGLTTGPHVCFRFLKDGKAFDHLTERFFTENDRVAFEKIVAERTAELDRIPMLNYNY